MAHMYFQLLVQYDSIYFINLPPSYLHGNYDATNTPALTSPVLCNETFGNGLQVEGGVYHYKTFNGTFESGDIC